MIRILNNPVVRIIAFLIVTTQLCWATGKVSDNVEQLLLLGDTYYSEIQTIQVRSDRWTRYEFSRTYVDPIVVLDREDLLAFSTDGRDIVVGVRNVSTTGVDIMVRLRYSSAPNDVEDVVIPVSFSVVELQTLPPEAAHEGIFQIYSWD
jgi:hypothetical protein